MAQGPHPGSSCLQAMNEYWRLDYRRLTLWGLLPVVIGLGTSIPAWNWQQQTASFIDNLRQTDGRVLRINRLREDPTVEVEFFNQSGVRYTKTFRADRQDLLEAETIGRVSLIHDMRDADNAEIGHVVGENRQLLAYRGLLGFGLGFLLLGLTVILGRARQVVTINQLFQKGQVVQTEVRDNSMAPGRDVGRFTYAFRGPDGRWYEGKSPDLPAPILKNWSVGRPLWVAYDTNNPRRSEPDLFGVIPEARRGTVQTA